jgi:glycosyltransferase involved in cell wall biosynthesis
MKTINPATAIPDTTPLISVVVIGRNEGNRLVRCLESIKAMQTEGFRIETIYVDSASTDGSPTRAAEWGAHIIEVRPDHPSAALGRNAGWQEARGEFVLFLDGDTILHSQFVSRALKCMDDPHIAIVWGHRRELHPEHSIYNRILDLDWIYPPGLSEFCGGDALMRRSVLDAVKGFDASLIAGEEPELCRRIRATGHTILHIDAPMTLHDLAIQRFGAYWKRTFRAGYAYAAVSSRFADSNDPLWRADARRNLIHGTLILALLLMLPLAALWPPAGVIAVIAAITLTGRTFHRCGWKSDNPWTRLMYALHSHVQQIPILAGQLSYKRDLWQGNRRKLIEYNYPQDTQIADFK